MAAVVRSARAVKFMMLGIILSMCEDKAESGKLKLAMFRQNISLMVSLKNPALTDQMSINHAVEYYRWYTV